MAALYFLYTWDVVLFGYLAYIDSLWYLLVLLVGWLILDYFSVYIPLSALRTSGASGATSVAETGADESDSPTESNVEKRDKEP
ncbi:hypothetical protein JYT26_02080 [Beggiatoa alba]|nr:hypothetical protein [Beggiatoa alba]